MPQIAGQWEIITLRPEDLAIDYTVVCALHGMASRIRMKASRDPAQPSPAQVSDRCPKCRIWVAVVSGLCAPSNALN